MGRRAKRWHAAVRPSVCIAVAVAGFTSIAASDSSAATTPMTKMSTVWSGFEARDSTSPDLHGAIGNWTVPTVVCGPKEDSWSNAWVGIGGDLVVKTHGQKSIETLYQDGTESDCADGFPTYYAWQQEVGSPNIVQDLEFKGQAGTEVRLSDTVLAGDVMSASVIDRGLETHWSITDTRDGKHVWSASSIWRTDYQHKHTAECIVEDPRTPKGQILPLADFGQVPFSACQAVDEGGNLVNMASAQLPTGWSFREYSLDKNTRVESMPSLNPLALNWVAPTWTSVGPISTATATQDDGDVSCPTVTFCLAALTGVKQMDVWNGSQWSPISEEPPLPGLTSFSCTSATFCMGVGIRQSAVIPPGSSRTWKSFAVSWNGVHWGSPVLLSSFVSEEAYGVVESISCATETFCMAIGGTSHLWNGQRWSSIPAAVTGTDGGGVVDCVAPDFCMDDSLGTSTLSWNGSKWSDAEPIMSVGPGGSVSCASARFCVAGTEEPEPDIWNGKTWTNGPDSTGATFSSISSIDCTSSLFCAVTYQDGAASTWTGSAWSVPTLLFADQQYPESAVSCATSYFCMAVSGDEAYLLSNTYLAPASPASPTPPAAPISTTTTAPPSTPSPPAGGTLTPVIGVGPGAPGTLILLVNTTTGNGIADEDVDPNCVVYLLTPDGTSWVQSTIAELTSYLSAHGPDSTDPSNYNFLLEGSYSDVTAITQAPLSEQGS
jgi:hypothetical protein